MGPGIEIIEQLGNGRRLAASMERTAGFARRPESSAQRSALPFDLALVARLRGGSGQQVVS